MKSPASMIWAIGDSVHGSALMAMIANVLEAFKILVSLSAAIFAIKKDTVRGQEG